MRARTWTAAALLFVFAFGACLAACGGGGGGPPSVDTSFVNVSTFDAAALVLGQAVFVLGDANQGQLVPGPSTMARPGMPSGGPFYLPDISNHRVLGYHQPPAFSNIAANFALGQPGLRFNIQGMGATALRRPTCAAVSGGRLYVSDSGNHRVLIWNTLPDRNAAPADIALGQPDLATVGIGAGASDMQDPAGLCVAGTKLLVCDRLNHRVLVWTTAPSASGAPADLVLGQADFDVNLRNAGGRAGAATLFDPTSVWTDGERVIVADRGNHRVLVWTSFPTRSGQSADLVLGQPRFEHASAGVGPTSLFLPSDVSSNGRQVFVADAGNHRVLAWHDFPEVNGAPADTVLGQATFDHDVANDADQDGTPDAGPGRRTLKSVDAMLTVRVFENLLFVGDTGNHRLLVFRGEEPR